MKEIKITIDTNLLIYLFDNNSAESDVIKSCNLIKAIFECSKFVKLDIKISTSFEDDLSQDEDLKRREFVLFRTQNIFQQVSGGRAIFEKGELLPKNKEDKNDFNELRKILFPTLNLSQKSYTNNINDLRHIFTHIKNNRDIYITNDSNFLKEDKREAIKNAYRTQIMSADEFVSYINSFKDKDSYQYKSAPKRLDYVSTKLAGQCELDLTNNHGIYTIGNGDFIFEVQWGKCSSEELRIYNHPSTIEAIAIAEDKKIKEIVNERYYDFTDHCREMRKKKDIMILKNTKGYYAAIKMLDFEVKDRGGERNFVKFEYVINTTGSCNFKGLTSK